MAWICNPKLYCWTYIVGRASWMLFGEIVALDMESGKASSSVIFGTEGWPLKDWSTLKGYVSLPTRLQAPSSYSLK